VIKSDDEPLNSLAQLKEKVEVRGNNITANSPANSLGNSPGNGLGNNPGNNLGNSPGNNLGNNQLWYVDNGCSRHMTGEKSNFLSLTAAQGGSVAFRNGKSGTSVGIGKIRESLSHSIDGVYLVDGLRHNLLGVSQLCDKSNLVVLSSNRCLVVNMNTGDVVLRAKRHKNVYKVCTSSFSQNKLTCLSALNDDIMLWHKRLSHASLSFLNKLVSKDLVVGLPTIKYNDGKVCDACVKGKQVKNCFK